MQGMVFSLIAGVQRPNIQLRAKRADRAKHRACRDSSRDCTLMKKKVNYTAIKHTEMISGVVYKNRLMVPAGV